MNDGSRCRFCGRKVIVQRVTSGVIEVEHEMPVCATFDELMRGAGAVDADEPDPIPLSYKDQPS
jgi:hypothetical protein